MRVTKWVFISTTVFGMVLVAVSVTWFFHYRPTTYVFTGEIRNLRDYERVVSSNLYFRSLYTARLGENIPQFHNEEFAVIQQAPLSQNQLFDFLFSKGPGDKNPKTFTIKYDAEDKQPRFEVVWDDSVHENLLRRVSKSPTSGDNEFSFHFVDRAFAQGGASQVGAGEEAFTIGESPEQPPDNYDDIIRILQDEKTDVGSKIAALDKACSLDEKSLYRVITTKTLKEDMIVTVADLARHSDTELAFKARQLANAVSLNKIIADRLRSQNAAVVKDAQQIIRRLDKTQASQIVKSVNINVSAEMKKFAEDILSGRGLTPLKPTGSSQGDRYYVRAQWDPNNAGAVDCLTRLFNQELFDRPSLEKETEFMRGRNERWVYWYSKEWALEIATAINKCGGKSSFGSP